MQGVPMRCNATITPTLDNGLSGRNGHNFQMANKRPSLRNHSTAEEEDR